MKHTVQNTYNVDDDLHHKHSDKTERIHNMIHVILYTCHQLTGVCLAKVIHGQSLNMRKQFLTHLCADRYSDFVCCKFLKVSKHTATDSDQHNCHQ